MDKNKKSSAILGVVFVTIFLDMLGIGILIPIIPVLFAPDALFRLTPLGWSASENYILVGWLAATFPLLQFLSSPLLGQIADRYGRRRVLLSSLVGTVLGYLLFVVAILQHNFLLMFIARGIDGFTGGNIAIAQTIISDVSSEKNLARNFGLIGAAIGLGFVMGPVVGGFLSDQTLCRWFNPTLPFFVAALLSLANLVVLYFKLPETLQVPIVTRIKLTQPLINIANLFKFPQIKPALFSLFFLNAGFACFTTFWGIVLAEKLHFSSLQIGKFFAYLGVMIILAQGLLVRRLSGVIAEHKVMRISLLGVGLSLGAFYVAVLQQSLSIYVLVPLLAIFMALSKAFSSALLAKNSPHELKGVVMGINSSSNALAQAIPAVISGYLASVYATLPILLGAGLVIIGWAIFVLQKTYKNTQL